MIVFEVPGQFLTSGKLPIARNAPGGQEGLGPLPAVKGRHIGCSGWPRTVGI